MTDPVVCRELGGNPRADRRWVLVPLILGLLAGLLLVADCGNLEEAHASELRPHQTYGLALAALGGNEASLPLATERDLAVIHQAAGYHATTNRGRLRWLRAHSARVLGDRVCRAGRNCRWSRALWRRPDRRPPVLSPGFWEATGRARFEELRRIGEDLATGRLELEPCPVPVVSWGNGADFGPGETPIDCGARIMGSAARPRGGQS